MRWRKLGKCAAYLSVVIGCGVSLPVFADPNDATALSDAAIDLLVTDEDVWAVRARFFVESDQRLADILDTEDERVADIDAILARTMSQLTSEGNSSVEGKDAGEAPYRPSSDELALAKEMNVGSSVLVYPTSNAEKAASVIALANEQLGIDYVWGGKSPSGFDCSGLTQYVFRHALGVEIGEWTLPQSQYGERIPVSEAQPGDLYFWGEGVARHVALAVGDNMYIHAPQPGTVVRYNSTSWYMPDYAVRMFDD